jgi:hypothetical protein
MPFWTWDALDTAWSARYNELVAYRTEHGRFPPRTMPGGLAAWIQTQRNTRATMDPERKERLDAISFVWDVPETVWSSKYDELIAYHAEHGRLPPESTPVLGTWIQNQRQGRSTMDPERKARLDAFSAWSWSPLDEAWSARYGELLAYQAEHGMLPPPSMTGLGKWVRNQRNARSTMSADRKAKLESVPHWKWPVRRAMR